MKQVSFASKMAQMLRLKCPNCGQGKVFKTSSEGFKLFPEMNERCEKCHHHFDREPGYFLGAMYASYGLAVFEGLASFLLAYFLIPGLSTFFMALIPATVILLLASRNYKLGRVIWMNLFPR